MSGARPTIAEAPPAVPITWSRLRRIVRLGVKSLWSHRLRSLLTVLGIVFGVCSVIAMLAVGEGASAAAQEQIRQLGSNNVIVESVKPSQQETSSGGQSRVSTYGLTYKDLTRIESTLPSITHAVPQRIIRKEIRNGTRALQAEIIGTLPAYQQVQELAMVEGQFLSDTMITEHMNACVLAVDAAEVLFPFGGAVGDTIRIGDDYYRVVGLFRDARTQDARNAQTAITARVFIPLTSARSRMGEILMRRTTGTFEAEKVELHRLVLSVASQSEVGPVAAVVGELLAAAHKQADYRLIVPLELLRQAERTKRLFNIVLGSIAGISLLVGGIGIMNIMLASVTERTREIGIRRALGARRRDIVIQFLVETVILSAAGGLIGVALGLAIPMFITLFAEMRTIVTPEAPLLAFTISALVGVVFGIYPAIRAANMDPVEALRHD